MEKNGKLLLSGKDIEEAYQQKFLEKIDSGKEFLPYLRYGMLKSIKKIKRNGEENIFAKLPFIFIFKEEVFLLNKTIGDINLIYAPIGFKTKNKFIKYLKDNEYFSIFCDNITMNGENVIYKFKKNFKVITPEMLNYVLKGYVDFLSNYLKIYSIRLITKDAQLTFKLYISEYMEDHKKPGFRHYFPLLHVLEELHGKKHYENLVVYNPIKGLEVDNNEEVKIGFHYEGNEKKVIARFLMSYNKVKGLSLYFDRDFVKNTKKAKMEEYENASYFN